MPTPTPTPSPLTEKQETALRRGLTALEKRHAAIKATVAKAILAREQGETGDFTRGLAAALREQVNELEAMLSALDNDG
jgi:hypothetical protein